MAPNNSQIYKGGNSDKYIARCYENIKTDLITITRDKLKIILLEDLEMVRARGAWKTPLTLFISLGIALLTAEFSSDTIRALFGFVAAASMLWLVRECRRAYKSGRKRSVDELISTIVKDSNE